MKKGMSFALVVFVAVIALATLSFKDVSLDLTLQEDTQEDQPFKSGTPGIGTLTVSDFTGETDFREEAEPYVSKYPMIPVGCRLASGTWHWLPHYIGCSNVDLVELSRLLGRNVTEGDVAAACSSVEALRLEIECNNMGGHFVCIATELSCRR